ncbi:MAG: PAS domain S-box protein [Deltaproteobacteria bacterium]|nr:PAS domain S-box protein [Deltaproteobacteria bacterium]
MEAISRSQDRLSPEYSKILFKRHLQGALVRSGASLIMGLFAVIAFYVGSFKPHHLAGVGFSILFLILINPPTLWILKRIKSRLVYRYFSLLINFLEIIGYTGIIYSLGGIEAYYLTPIYAALITYVGTVSPRSFPFIVAALCALSFSSMMTLEYLGYLPHQTVVSDFHLQLWDQMLRISVVIGLLFVIAYISSYTASTLKRARNRLHRKNIELQASVRAMRRESSERKKAKEALRESEEKYRTILESLEDGYYEVDIAGNITFFNDALCEIFGYSGDELMGMNNRQYTDKEYARKLYQTFNRVYTTEKPDKGFDWKIIRKDGARRYVEASVAIRKDSEAQRIGFRGIVRDVSERRHEEEEKVRLEVQLQQAQKMEAIGTLAGGVAHDLNNILGGLVSYPELLLVQIPEDSPLRKPMLTIQKSGEKAAAVVQDLLTLARRGVVVTEVVNPNHIISEYLGSPEHEKLQSYHPGVHIERHLEKDVLNILGSPAHLSKTIMNLVSNAAEAMSEGGKLTVSTENRYVDRPVSGYDDVKEGDYVVLTVSDTGSGIAPEDMEKIFEPFYTKKKMGRNGTGLGMAVVWGTVKDHNGYIHVQSTEGKGATFTLYFPVTRKSVEEKSEISSTDFMGRGEAILVVDDVEEQRKIASGMLKELGYSVSAVSSGEEAFEYLKTRKVDLLILDMIMEPGMDGLDTYKRILELHPGQKAIIASGFSETDRVKEVQSLGAGAYIKKPFLLEKIGVAVKEELEK